MAKYYAIVNKNTGEISSDERSGLYSTSNDTDLNIIPVHENCMLVELTQEEAGEMQQSGFEVSRGGKKVFLNTIHEFTEEELNSISSGQASEQPVSAQKHKIDVTKATKRLKDRPKETVTINEFGISYQDIRPVKAITERRK